MCTNRNTGFHSCCKHIHCPIHCKVLEWNKWNVCTKSCGGGTTYRTPKRTIINQYGGNACPPQEDDTCNSHPCPQDCTMGKWSEWTPCSVSCGHADAGVQSRSRTHISVCMVFFDIESRLLCCLACVRRSQ